MSDEKEVPRGRLSRLARYASLGAKLGARKLLASDPGGSAQRTAEVLGNMRGLAAKLGQMASYVDGVIPEGQRDVYETALKALRAAAPHSAFRDVKASIERELGAPLAELFATFEEIPFASASLGQVHRATLRDGTPVAVKVQHPGIDRAVESDLRNGTALEMMQRAVVSSKLETKRTYEEISAQFRSELDYVREADHQERFREMHAHDSAIVIPRVYRERSSQRVLTSELIDAPIGFDEACAQSIEKRAEYARILWRFVFRGILRHGLFNADPHPGNYMFYEDGRVAFFDFGCVVVIEPERRALAQELHELALAKDEARFRERGAVFLDLRGGPLQDMLLDYLRRAYAPIFDSPIHVTRPWAASMVHDFVAASKLALKVPREQIVPMPEGMVFMNRLQFGFLSVLARLDVEVDYAHEERVILAE